MDTPVTLLESPSPYGSRRVTVEYDGLTTAAYLHDEDAVISATWIANHQPAPDSGDPGAQARLDAGRTPLMPASLIKHPGGRGSLRGSARSSPGTSSSRSTTATGTTPTTLGPPTS